MSVGSRIKHLRDSLGLSLNAFSKELGVCEKVLRSWELNEAKIHGSAIYLIYTKWGITPNALILGNNFDKYSDTIRFYFKDENISQYIENMMYKNLKNIRLNRLSLLIGTSNSKAFIEKLAFLWRAEEDKILIVWYYFIEHIQNQKFEKIDQLALLNCILKFSIAPKVRNKYSLNLNKSYRILFIDWVKMNFNDFDSNILLSELPKTKNFIESELIFLQRSCFI